VDGVRLQYHARVGTPPQDRIVVRVPREDAGAVRAQQGVDVQPATRSLGKTLRHGTFEIRSDTAFEDVIDNCADLRRDDGTWINPAIRSVYVELFERGYAHSIETWVDDNLVGGLYGLAIGRVFFGESMFHVQRDASKLALVHLCRQLERWNYGLIDCQMETTHLASMGAVPIPRDEFIDRLADLVDSADSPGKWQLDHDLSA